jgi:chromatin assembly factor 1 subunit A
VKKLTPAVAKADPTVELVESETTDFEKDFLPFFVQNHMEVASMGQLSSNELTKSKTQLDDILLNKKYNDISDFHLFFASKTVKPVDHGPTVTPDDIVNALNSSTTTETQINEIINKFPPIKFISFYENSKPPYIGTWCSVLHQRIKFDPRNPLDTTLTGFDYEYDSDLEWNKEDEEGEDIDNEDEDDEEDILADEDDLRFVEDDKPNDQTKKFHSLNVMIKINDGSHDGFFNSMKTIAMTELPLPIDPFEITTKPKTPEPVKTNESGKKSKPIIDDTTTINQLIKFLDSSDFSSFSLNTILELAMKHIEFSNKSLMRNTLHHILKKERLTLTWSIKENARKEYTPS